MQIFFQTKKIDLAHEDQEFMARRMEGLNKFFSSHARAFVDVEKTRASNNGRDLYYTALNIEDGAVQYFTEDYQSDIRKSFDNSYAEIYRTIRNDRSKSRSVFKSAGRKFKSMFKKRYK